VSRRVITEAVVRAAAKAGRALAVPRGAIITPAARDLARALGLSLQTLSGEPSPEQPQASPDAGTRPPPRPVVALGADHGGYPMKEQLKPSLAEAGYEVLDLGAHDTAAVDYPDYAVAVAGAVADGRAWRGIMIDGAGIGSAMAANKVAGVRAALCYDLTTARNAREHNDANVLTLGGTLIGTRLAVDIVRAFLATPFGGGRHARRVDKINSLDSARG
jgi:ribose 5-phosphate isomerase B